MINFKNCPNALDKEAVYDYFRCIAEQLRAEYDVKYVDVIDETWSNTGTWKLYMVFKEQCEGHDLHRGAEANITIKLVDTTGYSNVRQGSVFMFDYYDPKYMYGQGYLGAAEEMAEEIEKHIAKKESEQITLFEVFI